MIDTKEFGSLKITMLTGQKEANKMLFLKKKERKKNIIEAERRTKRMV